jgi:hypothetical protein
MSANTEDARDAFFGLVDQLLNRDDEILMILGGSQGPVGRLSPGADKEYSMAADSQSMLPPVAGENFSDKRRDFLRAFGPGQGKVQIGDGLPFIRVDAEACLLQPQPLRMAYA